MPPVDPNEVEVVALPPERRRQRSGAPAQAGQCCCCCCCCLHTIGGLIGAAVAPTVGNPKPEWRPRTQEEDDYGDADLDPAGFPTVPPSAGISAVALFWWTTLVLTLVILAGGGILQLNGGGLEILSAIVLLALGLPVVQLCAAAVPAIYFGIANRPDHRYQYGQLGKVLLGLIMGTIFGIVVMVGIGIVLSAL